MLKCDHCNHMNNDGSRFCLYCGAAIQAQSHKSDYDLIIAQQRQQEELIKGRQKKAGIILAIILATAVLGFAFFAVRVKTGDARAEQLVEKYIKTHVIGESDVTFVSCTGSCLNTVGFTRAEGFDIIGYITVNENQLPVVAVVEMRGIFDDGKIQSVKINYEEIYHEDSDEQTYILYN